MAKISIIVPYYNTEKYIGRCIESILKQTFNDFELILVDDGSIDSSNAISANYAKRDNRIIIIHKSNGGVSDARNAGIDYAIKNSNSEWLSFIDSDDWVHEQFLEKLYKNSVNNNSDVSMCGIEVVCDQNFDEQFAKCIVHQNETIDQHTAFERLSQDNGYGYACAKLLKKSIFTNIRFRFGCMFEDAFIIHHIFGECKRISFINDVLYYYFRHCESVTGSNLSPKRLDILDAVLDRINYFDSIGEQELSKVWVNKFLYLIAPWVAKTHQDKSYRKYYVKLKKQLKSFINNNKHRIDVNVYDVYLKTIDFKRFNTVEKLKYRFYKYKYEKTANQNSIIH